VNYRDLPEHERRALRRPEPEPDVEPDEEVPA
jgi:hypothetical protein